MERYEVKLTKDSGGFGDTLPTMSLTVYPSYDLATPRGVTAE